MYGVKYRTTKEEKEQHTNTQPFAMRIAPIAPSNRIESLENHILKRKAPPTSSVDGFDVSARQGVDLGRFREVPGPKIPMPASSARPGKMTNQHIPYPRVMFVFPDGPNPIVNQMVTQGEIVFVNRFVHEGVSSNRTSKICSIDQMNAVLDNHSEENRGRTFVDLGTNVGNTANMFDYSLTWGERWVSCSEVAAWLPDGVVLTAEHQHERPYQNVGSVNSNPGEAYNVVVQGPVLCKKKDMKFSYLDVVYLCLFGTEHAEIPGKKEKYRSFRWETKTMTQLEQMRDTKEGKERLQTLICRFKVGKVLDANATREECNLNVCIEEVDREVK